MRVLMYQDRFAELVRRGVKRQTIRAEARCKPGDVLSHRRWTGKAYRSKQEILGDSICLAVEPVTISSFDVRVDGMLISGQHMATLDGFRYWEELRDWFEQVHGLPFSGHLIRWGDLR